MAKIALISLYDNWALGVRTLSNALFSKGHDVDVIHFKLPFQKRLEGFLKHPVGYENLQSRQSDSEAILTGYNIDVNMWTPNECELLGDLLEELRPDIIGITTRTVYERYIGCIIEQINRVKTAVKVAGGFGATMNPAKYMDDLDYVCLGEGEESLVRMAECVDKGSRQDIRYIPNLAYKLSGEVIFNNMEKPNDTEDYFYNARMEQIPHYVIENNMMGKTDVFMEYVREIAPSYTYHAQTAETHYYTMVGRGCMWSCSFCSAGQFHKVYSDNDVSVKRRRNRKLETIIEELKLAKKHGFNRIYFMDSFLIGEKLYLLEFFDLYKKEVNIPFFAQLFPGQVFKDPEILDKAVEAGMISIVVGIQSGSERVRNEIFNRDNTNESIIKFSYMINRYDKVFLDYHIITHNPFETIEDIDETFDLIARLPKKNAQIVLLRLRPFPGSDVEKMIDNAGLSISNIDEKHKQFLLYLIRFFTNDREFEKIKQEAKNLSFEDLKKLYSDIRKTSRDSISLANLGLQYSRDNNYDKAISSFDEALALDSRCWAAFSGKGWVYYHKKEYSKAMENFEDVLEHLDSVSRDTLQETQRGIGWTCYCVAKYNEAINYFNQALENTDIKAKQVLQDILRGLGWAYFRLGEFEKSADCFKKAIDNIGKNEEGILQDALKGLELAKEKFCSKTLV